MNDRRKQIFQSCLMWTKKLGTPKSLCPTWSVCPSLSWSLAEFYSGRALERTHQAPRPTCQAQEEGQEKLEEKPVRLEEVGKGCPGCKLGQRLLGKLLIQHFIESTVWAGKRHEGRILTRPVDRHGNWSRHTEHVETLPRTEALSRVLQHLPSMRMLRRLT